MKRFNLLAFIAIFSASSLSAATDLWTDGAGDQTWSSPTNWNNGVPSATSDVQIAVQPTLDQIGIDGGGLTTVASFTFNNTLTGSVDIAPFGGDTLSVTGAIANNSTFSDSFSLPVLAGGSATWTGGTAGLVFGNIVNFQTRSITLANLLTFSGPSVNFDITNTSTYGRFLGAGTAIVSGIVINVGGTYTGVLGNSFDLTSGSFAGASIGTLPTLTGGLLWDTSSFLTTGQLTVVAAPEPSTYALMAVGLGVLLVASRRKKAAVRA
jgi:hypothetical protein